MLKRRGLQLDLELGPAYRHTGFTDGTTQSSVAGARLARLSTWRLLPGLGISQTASAYVQRYNTTRQQQIVARTPS